MIRLCAIAALIGFLPGVPGTEWTLQPTAQAQGEYVPYDYSKSFRKLPPPPPTDDPGRGPNPPPYALEHPPAQPAPDHSPGAGNMAQQPPLTQPEDPPNVPMAHPETQPDSSILDLDDLRRMIDERPEPPQQWEPVQPPEELPQKAAPGQQPQRRQLERNTQHGRPQLVILTSCSWNERDIQGRFNSSCGPCNAGNTAVAAFVEKWQGKYTAGPQESADLRIVDVTTPAGRAIDLGMGENGYSLTELVAKANPAINQYTPATPVFVTLFPDRDPQIFQSWPPGLDPTSDEAAWWLWGRLGVERDNPRTWGVGNGADLQAFALWIRNGPNAQPTHTRGWGATVPASQLIEMLAPGGRRQLFGDTYLVVPSEFRPYLSGSQGNYRINFSGRPHVEYKFGFLNRRANLTHATVADDFSRIIVHAEGYRANFTLNIDLRN